MTTQTSLADKIPSMSDADLKTLRANAERLVEHGAPAQVSAAGDIIPLIAEQQAARQAAKPAPARKKAAPKKAKPAAPVESDEEPGGVAEL